MELLCTYPALGSRPAFRVKKSYNLLGVGENWGGGGFRGKFGFVTCMVWSL